MNVKVGCGWQVRPQAHQNGTGRVKIFNPPVHFGLTCVARQFGGP